MLKCHLAEWLELSPFFPCVPFELFPLPWPAEVSARRALYSIVIERHNLPSASSIVSLAIFVNICVGKVLPLVRLVHLMAMLYLIYASCF